jgi:Leucine-rich repeat (LRR) protein
MSNLRCSEMMRPSYSLVAKSMREALLMNTSRVQVLDLSHSPDIVCVNLMCDKLGGPCVCRLARFIEQNKWNELKELKLKGNKMETLPPSIFLQGLHRLDVSDNLLTDLPSDISKSSLITEIDVSNNRLKVLPWQELSNLNYLSSIKLRGNRNVVVDSAFPKEKVIM